MAIVGWGECIEKLSAEGAATQEDAAASEAARDVDALKRALWLRVGADANGTLAEVILANGDVVRLHAVTKVSWTDNRHGGVTAFLLDGKEVSVETGKPSFGELSAESGLKMTWLVRSVEEVPR